jgi:hypothetical protein
MANVPEASGTLADHLRIQLDDPDLTRDIRQAAEVIISQLDSPGYVPESFAGVIPAAAASGRDGTSAEALRVVQRLDPARVGVQDCRECLLLKCPRSFELCTKLREVIERQPICATWPTSDRYCPGNHRLAGAGRSRCSGTVSAIESVHCEGGRNGAVRGTHPPGADRHEEWLP